MVEEMRKAVRTDVANRAFGFQFPVISCGATYAGKRVWGYAPVAVDGSACFRVPAGRPIYFLALDAEGRALQRMRTFTHLMPGEVQGCVGCHEPRHETVGVPRLVARVPDRLRPPTTARRSRRGVVLLTVVPVVLLAFPRWQVEDVRVDGCPKVPPSTVSSLYELVGQPALGLDVQAIRDAVGVWPGVGEVAVELELPGTVRVRAESTPISGSVRIGRSWHGIGDDGGFAGVVDVAYRPVLEGFDGEEERSRGLAAARRLEQASGARVLEISRVTPADYRVRLVPEGLEAAKVIHVHPGGSVAESSWCAAMAGGAAMPAWADLRWPDRMVIGGER